MRPKRICQLKTTPIKMSTNHLKSAASVEATSVSNKFVVNSLEQMAPENFTVKGLTALQLERFYSLSYLYGEEGAMKIVSNVTSHGMDSWGMITQKTEAITDMDSDNVDYHDALEKFITIGQLNSIGDIIHAVAMIRRELGLKPHKKDILKSCVADFFARHMVKTVFEELPIGSKDKPKVIGYIATFNLNCQL